MNSPTDAYTKKVWAFLQRMKPGERYIVSELCEPANSEKFIEAIKSWMDQFPYQGGLNFNSDYSEFYMVHIPEEALKKKDTLNSSIDV